MKNCLECGILLSNKVIDYSIDKYNIPLCIKHQRWIDYMQNFTTFETIRLYFALKTRKVPAKLEQFDGHKHIDIAIPEAKIYIEVDGKHHNYNKKQALADLKRTYYSFLNGYYTLRIPNSLVYNDYDLDETAEFIIGILNESVNRNNRQYYNRK